MDLLTVLAYRPEQFQFDFTQVLAKCLQDKWLPGYRGWVFAPQRWLGNDTYEIIDLWNGRSIERRDVTHLSNPFWQRQQLSVASYPLSDDVSASVEAHDLLVSFRLELIGEQIRLIGKAVNWCQEFLSSRTIGQQKLCNHPAVVQILAKLVRDVYALNAINLAACLTTRGGRRWLIDEVDTICEQLIKLAGGRAMLSGQMVYLRTLFLTLNRLYIED